MSVTAKLLGQHATEGKIEMTMKLFDVSRPVERVSVVRCDSAREVFGVYRRFQDERNPRTYTYRRHLVETG